MSNYSKFNPDQLRVPAGNGRESGRWSTDAGSPEGIHGNIILVSSGPDENEKERDYEELRERGEESPKEDGTTLSLLAVLWPIFTMLWVMER